MVELSVKLIEMSPAFATVVVNDPRALELWEKKNPAVIALLRTENYVAVIRDGVFYQAYLIKKEIK